MNPKINILFDQNNTPYSPQDIQDKIESFGFGYNKAVADIIKWSKELDEDGEVFKKCATRILTNFKMTRSGPFKGLKVSATGSYVNDDLLIKCWRKIGRELHDLKRNLSTTSKCSGRFLVESSHEEKEKVFIKIWESTKSILPYTMGKTSYGLVGASKIIFSVLPEVTLPTDNNQWRQLFKTVDLGDVNRFMATDTEMWEEQTKTQLDSLGYKCELSTIPAVYNVMAMNARIV